MAVRLIVELILGLLVIAAVLWASYRFAAGSGGGGAPELDVSRTPSVWYTDSRAVDGGFTEVGIVRVETRTGVIRERRTLTRLDNSVPGYSAALDAAMDEAYAAMRVANVNLNRR